MLASPFRLWTEMSYWRRVFPSDWSWWSISWHSVTFSRSFYTSFPSWSILWRMRTISELVKYCMLIGRSPTVTNYLTETFLRSGKMACSVNQWCRQTSPPSLRRRRLEAGLQEHPAGYRRLLRTYHLFRFEAFKASSSIKVNHRDLSDSWRHHPKAPSGQM